MEVCADLNSNASKSVLFNMHYHTHQHSLQRYSPQVSEDDVAVQIGELAENGKGDGDIRPCERDWCVEGMIQEAAYKHSKRPIVATVSEEVEDWHGAVTESVDEVRLQNAFGVVEGPVRHSDCLGWMSGLFDTEIN